MFRMQHGVRSEHCVMHRARQDRHVRDGSVKDRGVPTVSFDFAYTKAVEPAQPGQEVDAVAALVMVDSSTNYIACVPIRAKNQFDLMVREILQFTQYLGHAECNYLCDNEPSIRQVQQRAARARQGMGLATRCKTPAAYTVWECNWSSSKVGLYIDESSAVKDFNKAQQCSAQTVDCGVGPWDMLDGSWIDSLFNMDARHMRLYTTRCTKDSWQRLVNQCSHTCIRPTRATQNGREFCRRARRQKRRHLCGVHRFNNYVVKECETHWHWLEELYGILRSLQCTDLEFQDWVWW